MTSSLHNSAITVSPETILRTAQQAIAVCERMIARMESVERSVAVSEDFWDSAGASLLYGYFRADKKDYESIKSSLRQKLQKLTEIASLYKAVEKDAAEDAAHLPDTVFL